MIRKVSNYFLMINCLLFSRLLSAQKTADNTGLLTAKERNIVVISALSAQGNMPALTTSLNEGLNAGLTINEIKEMLVHLYAYTGFPRSLNALNNFMSVVEDRKKKGQTDAIGREASVIKNKNMNLVGEANRQQLTGRKIAGGVYDFAPVIDQYLKEHLFGAIFSRDVLDWKTREIVTIAALAAMPGVEAQLHSHFNVGMHNGLTTGEAAEITQIIETKVDKQQGITSRKVLEAVTNNKSYAATIPAYGNVFATGEKITNNNFTGTAYLQPMIAPDSANKTAVGNVTFEPGARSNWHYHPGGQILLAIDGMGYYQERGQPKKILRKGDSVKCPPNVQHWHGASANEKFVQVAITNNENGSVVWQQPVSEEEYNAPAE